MDAYYLLANAIIVQATKDYKEAHKDYKRLVDREPPHDESHEKAWERWNNRFITVCSTIDEVERFFKSGWFCALSDLDGETLLKKIREMEEVA